MSLGATNVGSGAGQADGGLGKQVKSGVVLDFEAVAGFEDDAAVAVAGVLAEADVGDEDQLFDAASVCLSARRPCWTMPFVVIGAGATLVLGLRQAEEEQAAEAQARGFFGLFDGLVDGEVEDARHGADGAADALAGAEKEGVDQVAGGDSGLADQGAQGLGAAEAAHSAMTGKLMEMIVLRRGSF
jgi:hypothetical protein